MGLNRPTSVVASLNLESVKHSTDQESESATKPEGHEQGDPHRADGIAALIDSAPVMFMSVVGFTISSVDTKVLVSKSTSKRGHCSLVAPKRPEARASHNCAPDEGQRIRHFAKYHDLQND